MSGIEVLISEVEAVEAKTKHGLGAYEYLIKRFADDHGLNFTLKDIFDKKRFVYQESTDGKWFKVTYTGDQTPA